MHDVNINWLHNRDPIVLHEDAAMRQAIYNILFFSRNECYFGSGDEVNLRDDLFELIPFDGDTLAIRSISDRITAFDSRLKLIESQSSVRAVGDQYQLHLVIEYDYEKYIILDQRVQT